MNVTLRQLQVFLAMAATRNFSRKANVRRDAPDGNCPSQRLAEPRSRSSIAQRTARSNAPSRTVAVLGPAAARRAASRWLSRVR